MNFIFSNPDKVVNILFLIICGVIVAGSIQFNYEACQDIRPEIRKRKVLFGTINLFFFSLIFVQLLESLIN